MTAHPSAKPANSPHAEPPRASTGSSIWKWVWTALGVFVIVAVWWNVRNFPDARVGNPAVTGTPRPFRPLLGYQHWIPVLQIFTLIAVIGLIVAAVWGWRRFGPHPYILMGIVTTIIIWQDPIMNWAPYAVYDPRLWHWPESWPLVSLAPTVEPFVVLGYVMFQFGPYFPAAWALRKIQARQPHDSFVWRHPLISLGVLIFIIGFVIDMILEVTMIHTGLYMYSQVIPFGSIFVGTPHQFPLLWESSLVTLVMIPAGVLVYRDDTGRTVSENWPSGPASSRADPRSGRSWSCSSSSTCSICFTGSLLPPSSGPGSRHLLHARGPIPKRKSMTRRDTTNRTVRKARIR